VAFRCRRLRPEVAKADAQRVSARMHLAPSSRRLVIAGLLVVPAAIFVMANVLQYGLGVKGAADWFDPLFDVAGLGWLLSAVILAGPVAALLLAASRLLPIKLIRDGDAWEVRIRVRTDRWAIAIAAVSLLVGGILAGHLVAENLACTIGVASHC
jgi:hypothetical protein